MSPADYAKQAINEFSIATSPALRFAYIFKQCGIICDEAEYGDKNYSGSLHRRGDEEIILVNTDLKN